MVLRARHRPKPSGIDAAGGPTESGAHGLKTWMRISAEQQRQLAGSNHAK